MKEHIKSAIYSFIIVTNITTIASVKVGAGELSKSYYNGDPELTEIPKHIIQCYTDDSLWNRFQRLPSSIDSLVALIRKVELHPRIQGWSMGHLAASLLHNFRFDGIEYDRCIDTSSGAFPIRLDVQTEYPKMQLIWQLFDGSRQDFPLDALSDFEKCSLHWMMSYSINTTMRDEEVYVLQNPDNPLHDIWYNQQKNLNLQSEIQGMRYPGRDDSNYNYEPPRESFPTNEFLSHRNQNDNYDRYGFKHVHQYNCDRNRPHSFAPLEGGVGWSRAGPVAIGTMITGLAAAMEPSIVNWLPNSHGDSNVWASTLAGDLAQTSLLKRKGQTYVGPDGYFNNTLCPTEFMLRISNQGGDTNTFSHLTIAEINGGIDGLLLGIHAKRESWSTDHRTALTLSQVIDRYYSRFGLPSEKGSSDYDNKVSACQRYKNYESWMNEAGNNAKLKNEAKYFALEYKKLIVSSISEKALDNAIAFAAAELEKEITLLESSFFQATFDCLDVNIESRKYPGSYGKEYNHGRETKPRGEIHNEYLLFSGISDVGLILDTSIYAANDDLYQIGLASALALELDIWTTYSSEDDFTLESGSRFEVSEGRFGDPILNFHTKRMKEDFSNKAKLACDILKSYNSLAPTFGGQDIDPAVAIPAASSRIAKRRASDIEAGLGLGRSQVVVLVTFGRLGDAGTPGRIKLQNSIWNLRKINPDLRLLIATRWAPPEDFYDLVDDPIHDVIVLQQVDDESNSIFDARKIASRIRRLPGQITFGECSGYHHNAWNRKESIFVLPRSQRWLEIQSKYFIESEELELKFEIESNHAKICWTRNALGYIHHDGEVCEYADENKQIIFTFGELCSDEARRKQKSGYSICPPLFFRIEGEYTGSSRCTISAANDLPCRMASASEIIISGYGMTCSSAKSWIIFSSSTKMFIIFFLLIYEFIV